MQSTNISYINSFEKRRALFGGFSLFAMLILLFVVVLTSLSTKAPLFLVLLGFSPTLLTIVCGIIIYEEMTKNKVVLWILPFLLAGLFFYVLTSNEFIAYEIKVEILTALNIFFSVAYLAIFSFYNRLLYNSKPKKSRGAVRAIVEQLPRSISEYIASIEDKSKALNFVIGRVYSVHKGGTKQMREKITISPKVYNEFSDIMADKTSIDEIKDHDKLVKAVFMVNKIEEKLNMLIRPELEVFGKSAEKLKGLKRNSLGTDRIIDVLIRNDKDPVESYYKGALEFCKRLKERLNKRIHIK